MRKLFKPVVIAALLVACVPAFSQQTTAGGFYVGGEFGAARIADRGTDYANSLVSLNGGTATATQGSTSLGVARIAGGYKINENIGLEIGALQTGSRRITFVGVSRSGAAYSGSRTLSSSGLDFSVLIRPSASGRLNGLFLKAGMHSLTSNSEFSGVNISGVSSSTTGSGSLLGIGYDFKLNNKLDLRMSYVAYNTVSGISDSNLDVLGVGLLVSF